MGKAPAFQFYTGDWVQDTRCISLAAKGAWIDLLAAMWHSQNRGELSYPMTGYARIIGATVEQTEAVITELIDMRICDSVTNGNGIVTLQNRRMIREEKERNSTRSRVEKWRNVHQKRDCNESVTVPSSSSSSSSKKENIKRKKILSNEEWETQIKKLFSFLDWEAANREMDAWLLNHPGRQKTRQFISNWLSKKQKDKPIENKTEIQRPKEYKEPQESSWLKEAIEKGWKA